jgi:hypothetical protein
MCLEGQKPLETTDRKNGFRVQISNINLSNTKQDSYQLNNDIQRRGDHPGTRNRSSEARSVCTRESQTGNPSFQEYMDAFLQTSKAYFLMIHCSGTIFTSTPVSKEIPSLQKWSSWMWRNMTSQTIAIFIDIAVRS